MRDRALSLIKEDLRATRGRLRAIELRLRRLKREESRISKDYVKHAQVEAILSKAMEKLRDRPQ